jgi:putative spermidine/putrescine transport system ATP-binding protein
VTHDQTEAMAMADRLVVMHNGRVQQIGTPEQVHSQPANPFVARFIGGSNVATGTSDGQTLAIAGARIALAGQYAAKGDVTLAVRPESLRLGPPASGCVDGEVELCTWLGSVVEHAVRISPDIVLLARGPGLGPDAAPRHSAGTRVALCWGPEDEFLFNAEGRAIAAEVRETSHA